MFNYQTLITDSDVGPVIIDERDGSVIEVTELVADGLEAIMHLDRTMIADAQQTVLFARQLEAIESKLYEVKRRQLKYLPLLPQSSEPGPGAQKITYYLYDKIGAAKIIANPADDLPRVDIFATRHEGSIHPGGASFGYSTRELREAAFSNVPLDMMKVSAARRAMEELENRIAWNGDSTYGLLGLFSNPNVPQEEVALNEALTSRLWADKSADEIIDDVSDLLSSIRTVTRQVHQADVLLLPIAQYELIRRKRIGGLLPHMTVYQYLLDPENGQGLSAIEAVPELEGAGEGGTDMMLAYENDSDVLENRIPMPMTMLPVQYRNLQLIFNLESEIGGVVVRYPLAIRKGYGI